MPVAKPPVPEAKPNAKSVAEQEGLSAAARGMGRLSRFLTWLTKVRRLPRLLRDDAIRDDVLLNEMVVFQRHKRLVNLLWTQSLTVTGLIVLFMVTAPFLKSYNIYYTLSPEMRAAEIVGLDMPNVTKRALLSWSATSITEILTLGFGDIDRQIAAQRPRFTSRGWEGFQRALEKQGLRKEFKSRQIVLTTAPSDSPVVVSEGLNDQDEYQWNIEMPVVMTFLTNNNVKRRQNALIRLAVVRVPPRENIQGIAIESWILL